MSLFLRDTQTDLLGFSTCAVLELFRAANLKSMSSFSEVLNFVVLVVADLERFRPYLFRQIFRAAHFKGWRTICVRIENNHALLA